MGKTWLIECEHILQRGKNEQGVLKIWRTKLDGDYLRRWAVVLGVADLLERALMDVGLNE